MIHYIEQTAKEAAAVQERLQKENEDLQTEADSLRTQVRELQTRLETETALREQAQSGSWSRSAARQGLEALSRRLNGWPLSWSGSGRRRRPTPSSGTGWGHRVRRPQTGR